MTFTFSDMTDNSAMVNLIWEKIRVSFKVEMETQDFDSFQSTKDGRLEHSFSSGTILFNKQC